MYTVPRAVRATKGRSLVAWGEGGWGHRKGARDQGKAPREVLPDLDAERLARSISVPIYSVDALGIMLTALSQCIRKYLC